jgi:hypothetical protein
MATGSFDGSVYTFDLSTSFDTSSNFSNVLNMMSIAGGAGSNIDPTYVDGAMFANNDEFYLYGFVHFPVLPCAQRILNYNKPP